MNTKPGTFWRVQKEILFTDSECQNRHTNTNTFISDSQNTNTNTNTFISESQNTNTNTNTEKKYLNTLQIQIQILSC